MVSSNIRVERGLLFPDKSGFGFDISVCPALPLIDLTLFRSADQLGREALKALVREIDHFPIRTRQRIVIQPQLVKRSTTR